MKAGSCVDSIASVSFLGALVLCPVHNVGPINQLGEWRRVEAVLGGGDVRQEARAGGVFGIEELAPAALRILLAVEKVLLVLGRQKGRQVVVEPPGNAWRGGVLEIYDGVLVAGKVLLVEERPGAVHQAVELVTGALGDALAMESRKQRGRTGSVETFVVIEDANPQGLNSLMH
jgi:hypothetical protein